MLYMYGVTEEAILRDWTVAQFFYYRDFALEMAKMRSGGV